MTDLSKAKWRVLHLLRAESRIAGSEGWVDAQAIREAAAGSEGLRRLRELRKHGFVIEKRKIKKSRLFEYRLIEPSTAQKTLF